MSYSSTLSILLYRMKDVEQGVNEKVIGDRCGDRLKTTCHHAETPMNKGLQNIGDR